MNDETALQQALKSIDGLDFAILVGSRARGDARKGSDWDIAIQWAQQPADALEAFSRDEALHQHVAGALKVPAERVDVVDLARAGLAMRAAVAEEGIPLAGDDRLPWMHFLTRTWRELEYWDWEQTHAA